MKMRAKYCVEGIFCKKVARNLAIIPYLCSVFNKVRYK